MRLPGYDLGETISRSARSIVRRARRLEDGAAVVVKAIPNDYPSADEISKLEFEFRVLRKCAAPGVLRALELARSADAIGLVLEDFGGESLPSCADGKECLESFFAIAAAVTQALGVVHAQNVIHKDVKPRNLLMNPLTREVKLLDFNSASELLRERNDFDRPHTQQASLAYMSPEQTGRMNRDLDYRTDYYSLGVSFFELLTGTLPFSATDTMGWVHCHLSKAIPDPRSVNPLIPEPLARIVRKLMAKDPDARYQSARGLLIDLTRCQREWNERRTIAVFELGTEDVSQRFRVSTKLLGREQETAVLSEALEAVRGGPSKLLLVGGYAGVGKSSLIREVQAEVARAGGHYLFGQFDQLERNVPYGALLQALHGFVKRLLAEPEAQIDAWRQRLASALAGNARVLADLIPELQGLLGSTPAVPALAAQDALARLRRAFRDIIQALALPTSPLVLVIDDLQWTDASTPELLSNLLADEGLRHVLVIGAYRDNELDQEHVLLPALQDLEARRPSAIGRLALAPLSEETVQVLVAETLHCERARSASLAGLVFKKTAGNPFFVNELLRMLHRDRTFRFLPGEGRWEWDAERIQTASVSDNVVDLMVARLRSLPAATLAHLCKAACLGSQFDLEQLAKISDDAPDTLAVSLWEAVQSELVTPITTGSSPAPEGKGTAGDETESTRTIYEFQHGRVQHAAYLLLDEAERARLHLRIGRLELSAMRAAGREEGIFEVVNHLNLGRKLIADYDERAALAQLNATAGQRARQSAAYSTAISYFEIGLALLSAQEWTGSPELAFEYRRAHVECIWLSGNTERANRLADELIAAAPNKVSRGSALELKVAVLEHEGRMAEVVTVLRAHLSAFGIELPEDGAEIDRRIGNGIAKMKAHLARVRIEDLVQLPELEDRELRTAMSLLLQMIPSAIQTHPPLFVLAELIMFDITLTHGRTLVSCKNMVDCAIIQGGILGDYDTAYRLGQAAFSMLERYSPTPLEAGVNFVFAAFVSHWRAPLKEGLEAFERAVRVGVEQGDPRHASFARVHAFQRMLLVGAGLDDVHAEAERLIPALLEGRAANALQGARAAQRVVDRLRGSTANAEPSDAFAAGLAAFGNAQWLFYYGQAEMMASVLLAVPDQAEHWLSFTEPVVPAGVALYPNPDYRLFQTLVLVKRLAAQAEAERAATFVVLDANLAQLQTWASNCPENFEHKYKLAAAEVARARAAPTDEVLALYDAAIEACADGFIHLRALANERLSEFWSDKGQRKVARSFIEDAYYLYERWGAHAKLRQLEQRYPEWFARGQRASTTPTRTTTADGWAGALDLESIIKATQAISSEVKAERLFGKLMATLIENAGAARGSLILPADRDGELTVVARAQVDGDLPDAGRAIPLVECTAVCAEIVRYVVRTQDTVVVDDASHEPEYARYAYVQQNAVKSLLCLPILNQGKLIAILYAENNATTHAFTAQRLSLLRVIASQAAISITNARLYDSLEEKVAARTLELREKTRDITVMLNCMQQGIFTIDGDLLIQPEYSLYLERIVGISQIAGKDCLQTVFEGSSVGVDALDGMRAALFCTIGSSALFAESNASHLVAEFQRVNEQGETRHFEVDWNPIVGDDDQVSKMLVAIRDVSLLKQLKASAAANGRELAMLGQILEAGLEPFQRFCRSAHELLLQVDSLTQGSQEFDVESLEVCFRNMHTIKGNARLLNLTELIDTAHLAEEPYAALRGGGRSVVDRAELGAGVSAVRAAIQAYELVCVSKLGDLAPGSGTRAQQTLAEIDALLSNVDGGTLPVEVALRAVRRSLRRSEGVSLTEIVNESSRMLPSLASELDKSTPAVECVGGALLLGPAWAEVLRNVLMHAFRNSLDHGLESNQERRAAAKPSQGRIWVRVQGTERKTEIRLADDGRGLQLDVLRQRAGRAAASDDELANTVFSSGVTTATGVSATSGRGVGMNAIREFVRAHGGEAVLAFTGPSVAGRRPFELVIELPSAAALSGSHDSEPPRGGRPHPITSSRV
ncbi:MAG TPA: AAA family ATPase [Polyangiaceae bacterium]|nr:AAA family ATPase [Polyangiaceae bacterium]